MRPPEFTGGNELGKAAVKSALELASMRPPEFTGGNLSDEVAYCTPNPLQ